MPRKVNPEKKRKAVLTKLQVDPAHRFQVITYVGGPTYLKLLEDCLETREPLSKMVELACAGYYEYKQQGGDLDLDETGKTLLRALMVFWKCDSKSAIRRLIEKGTLLVLEQADEDLKKIKETVKKMEELDRATTGDIGRAQKKSSTDSKS